MKNNPSQQNSGEKYVAHCDNCERGIGSREQAEKEGWFMSERLSVSGIPWELLCPPCFRAQKRLNI